MEINKKNRTELKNFFKTNDKPTEEQFGELIDGQLNQIEDGIAKVPGTPLAVRADSEFGSQEILSLYADFNQDNPDWTVDLNPRVDPDNPDTSNPGLNIKDPIGKSRLFIQASEAKVGIGTIQPAAPLTVKGKPEEDTPDGSMQVADSSILFGGENAGEHKDSAKVQVDKESLNIYGKTQGASASTRKVTILSEGGMAIKGAVDIEGNISAENMDTDASLGKNAPSDEKIATQKAVKSYIDTAIPKGLISMWSGNKAPEGWTLCDGTQNTPDLSGRFIVGLAPTTEDYNEAGKKGGLENVVLTEAQMPAHSHSGNTEANGNHSHTITHKASGNDSGSGLVNYTMDGENHGTKTLKTNTKGNHNHSFTTNATGGDQPHENRPPYYVLAYIMKL